MRTLRREAIRKAKEAGYKYLEEKNYVIDYDALFEIVADAVLELRAFKTDEEKPKYNTAKWGLDWTAAGVNVSQEDIDRERFIEEALHTFEFDMGCPKNWNWYPARTSEEAAWKILREFVVEKYQENSKAFQEYKTWSTQQYARGAMTILAISKEPEKFPLSWTSFLDANPNYGKQKERGVAEDASGAPKTY